MDNKLTTQNASALLQFVRTATGWSEPRIARKLGVSQPTVHRILKGQNNCQFTTWQAIQVLHEQIRGRLAAQAATAASQGTAQAGPLSEAPPTHSKQEQA
jgi:transcriptional regulator with XRE-family HTH domain